MEVKEGCVSLGLGAIVWLFLGFALLWLFFDVWRYPLWWGREDVTIVSFIVIGYGIWVGFLISIHCRHFVRRTITTVLLRKLPDKPLNVNILNIQILQSSDRGNMLRRATNHLSLHGNSKCVALLRHGSDIIAKIVGTDNRGRWRVCLVGKDTTEQPFLISLPPSYWWRGLEACERWAVQASKNDTIQAT